MRHSLIFFLLFNLPVGLALATDVISVEMDEDTVVPESLRLAISQDMMALSKLSCDNSVPILLMFSTEDCTYCKRLEAEVLGPLRLSGADPERIILRKVLMDKYETLYDFSGSERSAENFGIDRGVEMVPTVQLVDAAGRELVPKIVGYQTPGLYDDYLEKAIEVSRELFAGC
ncbi:MAG: thioredoxin fold domain-containing protein [Gammaproteobacteria bacterium]|nr:thioredoxin fold domain-containing protein [Gammaproteobacteria bacterium]